jgi:hypothetical protein
MQSKRSVYVPLPRRTEAGGGTGALHCNTAITVVIQIRLEAGVDGGEYASDLAGKDG